MQLIKFFLQFIFIVLILNLNANVFACHPECIAQPPTGGELVTKSICTAVCKQPTCTVQPTSCPAPKCTIKCPVDQCESDTCPACETVCEEPTVPGCQTSCEAPQCNWKCYTPVVLNPAINFTCDQPTCEFC